MADPNQIGSLKKLAAANAFKNCIERLTKLRTRRRKCRTQKGADAFHEFVAKDCWEHIFDEMKLSDC